MPCGSSLSGNNGPGVGSFIGNPSGDVSFVVPVLIDSLPIKLSLTTCSASTRIDTILRLYDGCPSDPASTLLANQSDAYACSLLEHDVYSAGTYWLVVEGATASD